jgi:hypothetical protein
MRVNYQCPEKARRKSALHSLMHFGGAWAINGKRPAPPPIPKKLTIENHLFF